MTVTEIALDQAQSYLKGVDPHDRSAIFLGSCDLDADHVIIERSNLNHAV
ncbi:MAG: hypothetical protein ACTSYL_12445 [Candidatus Thorarchaeota archaeon]